MMGNININNKEKKMFGYHSAQPEYYWHQGKPHWNLGNDIVHSNFYKSLNPLRQRYEAHPTDYT